MSTPRDRLLEAFSRVETAVAPPEAGLEPDPTDMSGILQFAFDRGEDFVGFERRFKDVGIARAFTGGVKEGLLEPLTLLGREGEELRLDETSERVANFLGSMIGLGIGFIPFAAGTGVVLKGIGLTRHIPKVIAGVDATGAATRVINPTYAFVRNTIAGAAQFAAISEEPEDIPKNIALGAAFGVAVEGFFLARAIRGRRGFVNRGDTDVPVDLDLLAREGELVPGVNKTSGRIQTEVSGLAREDLTYEEILVGLSRSEVETVRIPGLRESKKLVESARKAVPGAQVLSRTTQGGKVHEVLIHNPIDDAGRLSEKQIAQWKTIGFYEGQPVVYDGRTLAATGVLVDPGLVQLRNPLNPKGAFAVRANEVTRPLTSPSSAPEALSRQRILTEAALDAETNVGFAIPAATVGEGATLSAKRGTVNVSEFEVATSLERFLQNNAAEISAIEASTREEALAIFAKNNGIKGIHVKDGGVTTSVHVFDQGSVSFISEPPRVAVGEAIPVPEGAAVIPNVGLEIDRAVVSTTMEGKTILQSFIPSWKNSIIPAFKKQGLSEKEINVLLDMKLTAMDRQLESLLDGEFLAIKKASELQFRDCL